MDKKTLQDAARAIRKVPTQKYITNAEIKAALEVYPDVLKKLKALGPVYRIAWRELQESLNRLEIFRDLRNARDSIIREEENE